MGADWWKEVILQQKGSERVLCSVKGVRTGEEDSYSITSAEVKFSDDLWSFGDSGILFYFILSCDSRWSFDFVSYGMSSMERLTRGGNEF